MLNGRNETSIVITNSARHTTYVAESSSVFDIDNARRLPHGAPNYKRRMTDFSVNSPNGKTQDLGSGPLSDAKQKYTQENWQAEKRIGIEQRRESLAVSKINSKFEVFQPSTLAGTQTPHESPKIKKGVESKNKMIASSHKKGPENGRSRQSRFTENND